MGVERSSFCLDGPTPESIVGESEERRRKSDCVQRALAQLDPRSRRVLEQRYLTPEVATLEMLGEELGVSRERVRQIERDAKERMRELCA